MHLAPTGRVVGVGEVVVVIVAGVVVSVVVVIVDLVVGAVAVVIGRCGTHSSASLQITRLKRRKLITATKSRKQR